MKACVDDNLRCLEQGLRLLRRLSDDEYARVDADGVGCAIGPHVRHLVDHYDCLLHGLRSGCVDYDDRPRSPALERERGAAIAAFERLARALLELDGESTVRVRIRAGARAEIDAGVHPSSLARELHYVWLHAIHHYAVIAATLRARGLACEPDFGVAPATLGGRAAGAPS